MKKPLGRGLSSLIGEQFADEPTTCPTEAILPNPRQPRSIFEESALNELAESIKDHGIMNPLIVRPGESGLYILIAGERRLRAAKIAGLTEVPIKIQTVSDRESLELAIVENVQREDIGPLECAQAYRRLMDEFELTQAEVAQKVGKSRPSVANQLRLLSLPCQILDELSNGHITEGHARALLTLDSEPHQIGLLEKIIKDHLSVRETEALASLPSRKKKHQTSMASKFEPEMTILLEQLSEAFGCPITIQPGSKEGKITFTYFGKEDLIRLIDLLLAKN